MISQELNDQITLVDAGKPAGEVLRRYWQPAALADELNGPRPVVPVTLLGEKLVLFRDEDGQMGLIGRHCPHRGPVHAGALGQFGQRHARRPVPIGHQQIKPLHEGSRNVAVLHGANSFGISVDIKG